MWYANKQIYIFILNLLGGQDIILQLIMDLVRFENVIMILSIEGPL